MTNRPIVAITGASGFIGKALVTKFTEEGSHVRAFTRSANALPSMSASISTIVSDLLEPFTYRNALHGAQVLVHLAGVAHRVAATGGVSEGDYEAVNVDATIRLAREAVAAGVKRLVFVSSVSVYGHQASLTGRIDESSSLSPSCAYGRSKLRAEKALKEIASDTGLELVIIRPALVVGSGAPGNLARLRGFIKSGLPMVVPILDNKRSFIARDDLVRLLICAAEHPSAPGHIFIAADDHKPSTRQVLKWIADGMGVKRMHLRLPGPLMARAFKAVGRARLYEKVFGDLVVSAGAVTDLLGFEYLQGLESAFEQLGQGE